MTHGIFIPSDMAAGDVNSLVKNFKGSADLDNGWVVTLGALTGVAGEAEVFAAGQPAATAGLTHLYFVDGESIVLTDSKFKNLDPNVQNYYVPSGKVFTGAKAQIGDIVKLSADCLATGTGAASAYAVAVASTYKLTWASAAISGVSLRYLSTDYVSLPTTGAIGESQRVTMYKFIVEAIA